MLTNPPSVVGGARLSSVPFYSLPVPGPVPFDICLIVSWVTGEAFLAGIPRMIAPTTASESLTRTSRHAEEWELSSNSIARFVILTDFCQVELILSPLPFFPFRLCCLASESGELVISP